MSKTWEVKWIEDIDFLKENLISRHRNLFFSISPEAFEYKISHLKSIVKDLDYEEMEVELSRIVASVRDAHTSIALQVKKYLPVRFYHFSDGIYITGAVKEYEDLLFRKVTAIEDKPMEEVLEGLSEIISYENQYLFKALAARYMQSAEILYGLMICDHMDKINITIDNKKIHLHTLDYQQLIYVKINRLPLYAERSEENYWFKTVMEGQGLYIKYNSCRECGNVTLKEKIEETIRFIEKNNITNVTVDLRNNSGGNSTLIEPLIAYIKNNKKVNVKGNLKVVIGRDTFSSALLNAYDFKMNTNAVLTGEPSGGKPDAYGEILRFNLPNSKFNVTYSTRFYKIIDDDSVDALYPDELIEEKISDWYQAP